MTKSIDSGMNFVEGAMTKCSVCNNSSNREQIPYCQKCGWPMGLAAAMPKHLALYEAILAWASQAYKDNLHLKNIIESSASAMSVQLQNTPEDAPDLELLKSELASLSNRIKTVEDNYSRRNSEPDAMAEKAKIVKDIQVHTKAIRDISDFLGQQSLQNLKLDDYKQSSEKALADHYRALQDLIREQQQQGGEIKILKSALSGRNRHQPLAITSGASGLMGIAEEISNAEIMTGLFGGSNSAPKESDLLKEYNSNSQEVPKSLRDGSKNVSIEDEAVVRIRDGNESNITFKLNRSGNFFIISRGGYCYLVPNKQRRIIPQMSTVTQAIYKCDGYSENYQGFRLIKPALVSEESGDYWKLSQKGILEFT
jgi:hypothetical protein